MSQPRVFLPSIASGALLWLAYFPMNLGPVAYVAMVPFLATVRAEGIGSWRRYLAAFLGGLTFSALALKWIMVAHQMMALFAWPMMSVYTALYWPLALLVMRKLDRLKWPLFITFPVVWVSLEYFRAHFPTGFPFLQSLGLYQLAGFGWYFLGHTQHAVLPLLQAADFGGVYIISVAVAAVNGAMHEWAMRFASFRWFVNQPRPWQRATYTHEMRTTAAAFSLLFGLIGYGTARLIHKPFDPGPRVAALQGDVPQDQKNIRGEQKDPQDIVAPLDRVYRDLLAVSASRKDPKPDLIIWPETCWSENWFSTRPDVAEPEDYARVNSERQARGIPTRSFADWVNSDQLTLAQQVIEKTGTHALIGLNAQEWTGQRWNKANSAILIRPDGQNPYAGRYDKMHLVPFGEYVPFRETLPWLKTFTPYSHDYSCTPGDQDTRLEIPRLRSGKELAGERNAANAAPAVYRFGVLICYEDTDPYLARQYNPASGRPNPVDFLVNMSNDGWFTGTEQHEQHLAIARFRAVEARRSLVRAVNMGISAIIDPDGRIVALPDNESWAKSKGMGVRAIVVETIPLDTRTSYYARFGDWVPALLWLAMLVGWIRVKRLTRSAVQ